ncbi:enoyl-CoA hydratase/isomerase family protein [Ottowia thiooxydans]|uniref:enoyl-CoA hydratase/isomerase family protein n=1 Tax=Ottowia thiooxydans TaxID=219182 RepID=UPI0004080B42|nr:enoyl-CoA hydratase/isomerase family protein [Ottowia thiooxydans]
MNTPEILCKHQHDVWEIQLHRPQSLNALTPEMAAELLACIQQGIADPQVKVLIIKGEGRAFCAGKDRDAPGTSAFVAALQAVADALVNSEKPSIAAVHGWAVGAGLELALNCDLVIASDNARFKLPEAQLGLPGTGGVHALLPRLIGLSRAKALLWFGQEFNAQQALQWGLLWSVVPPEQLETEVAACAELISRADPRAISRVKALLHQSVLQGFEATLEGENAP